PLLRHAELLAEQRLRRGRAQTDDDVGLHHRELRLEPRPARGLLAPRRLRVDPPLASRLPLEMLDRIRHVRRGAVDTGELERLVQQAPGRADERAPRAILLVARLLADEDDARVVGALAEHRLRPRLPERAAPAAGGRVAGAPAASGAREGRARPFRAHRCVSLTRGIRSLPLFAKLGPRMVVRPAPYLRVLPEEGHAAPELVESYRRLADVFHELLAEQSLDALLVLIGDALRDLIPHDTLTIYEADEAQETLVAVLARDQYADEIMRTSLRFDEGITGWAASRRQAVLVNQAHLDPRVRFVPGTPIDPEALISIPLVARSQIKGVLNIYRVGDDASFSDTEFELAKRFADAAALALDNAQIRASLEHQAQTDSLTGLFNHRSFHERLLNALQEASRTHLPVAVLMFDIDDFKRVNDVHGHGVGDELLRTLADTLRGCVRPDDVVCRLGGEEFGVIMGHCEGADALRVAERLVEQIGGIDFPGIGRLTVSVGVSLGPEHAMNPRELAACSEAAMMTAKAQGKNRIVLYEEDASVERPGEP